MKNIKSSFLFIMLLLSSLSLLSGQTSKHPLQLELGANGVLSINHKTILKAGFGTEMQLCLKKPLNKLSLINLTVAYRQLVGYDGKFVAITIQNNPLDTEVFMQTKELANLRYLDLSLGWEFRIKKDSPMSFGLGFCTSRLMEWNGHEQKTLWHTYDGPVNNIDLLGEVFYNVRQNESTSLAANNFVRYNFGLQLRLNFELLPGLELKTSFYRGLSSIFQEKIYSDASKYRFTSLSLGLAVRLF